MKIVRLKVASSEEARKLISELEVARYFEGDRVEVTFPSGGRQTYVFREPYERWEDEKIRDYIIEPVANPEG